MNGQQKIAAIYHYYEADETYRDNLIFFLAAAYREDVDFFVVISEACSVDLPRRSNIRYLHTENKNWDFGGVAFALKELGGAVDAYDCVVFINASVRGPFVPPSFQGSWVELFTARLRADTHLLGSSINIMPGASADGSLSHVQTTAYALTREALAHLIRIGFYDVEESLDKEAVIVRYEIGLSREILRAGWNMKCLVGGAYNSLDYRKPHREVNFTSLTGDPLYAKGYLGRTLHPTELVFIKTNRDMISVSDLNSHTYGVIVAQQANPFGTWSERESLLERARSGIEKVNHRKRKRRGLAAWLARKMFR